MKITNFGVLWTAILIIAWIKGEKALLKCVIFSAIFQAGAILGIRNFSLDPLTYSGMFFITHYFVSGRRIIKLPPCTLGFLTFWIVIFVTAHFSSVIFRGIYYVETNVMMNSSRYNGDINYAMLGSLFIYIITLIIIFNSNPLTQDEIGKMINLMFFVVLILGVWQYLVFFRIIPESNLIADLIYSNRITQEQSLAYYAYNKGIRRIWETRFFSCFMEPSYCGTFLGIMFCYYISKDDLSISDRIRIILILMMMLLTFSNTAFFSVGVGGLVALRTSNRTTQVAKIVVRGLILLLVSITSISFLNLWDMLVTRILRKSFLNSGIARSRWNQSCFDTFKSTFGLGLGYGNIRGSSLFFSVLGSCGLLGLIFLVFAFYCLLKKSDIYINEYNFAKIKLYRLLIVVTLLSMIISIPDISFSILWMTIYIYVSFMKNNTVSKELYVEDLAQI